MALTSATKVIRSALENIPTSGYSICHNGNNISHSQKWPFHLLQLAKTSAVTHVAVPAAALGVISAYTIVVIPSTTMAITSANSHCGYSICHSQKHYYKCGLSSSTIIKCGYSISHNGKNICHITTTWQITSANSI